MDTDGVTVNQVLLPWQTLGLADHHHQTFEHCLGDFGSNFFDEFASFETTAMDLPVVANLPVQVLVSLDVETITVDGTCDLDFMTDDRQIIIPAVILNLF
jgi:hypothetical protein